MKKYSYTYLSIGKFLVIFLSTIVVILLIAFLLIGIIKPTINWTIFILFLSPILFVTISNFIGKKKVQIKTFTIRQDGVQYDSCKVTWEQIKWYRFDRSKYGNYEKIILQTHNRKYKIHYFDTKSHQKEWKEIKNDLKIAIENNCPHLEKAKMY
ncbi:hypothetical protein [Labilibaculum euxinus]